MAVKTISFRSDESDARLRDSLESRGVPVFSVVLWKLRAEVRRPPLGHLGAPIAALESPQRHLVFPGVP